MAGFRDARRMVDTSRKAAHARPVTAQEVTAQEHEREPEPDRPHDRAPDQPPDRAPDAARARRPDRTPDQPPDRAPDAAPARRPDQPQDHARAQAQPPAHDARVRLARRAEAGLLALLLVDLLLVAIGQGTGAFGAAGLLLVAALAATAVVERRALDLAAARNAASEATLTRMLRGLSRSDSPDATVDAIVDDLREASGADHVVVARLKPSERIIEATLVSSSAAVPLSVTRFPASDLEPVEAFEVRARSSASPGSAGPPRPARVVPLMPDGRPPGTHAAGAGARGVHPDDDPMRPGSTMYAVQRITDRVSRAYGLRHVLAEPLVAGGHVVGALVLSRRTDSGWPAASRQVLMSAAQDLSTALERAYAHQEARVRAATDALTGIPNRAYFEELVEMLGRGGRRANDALGILMLDLDHFKALNDRYGHPAGDEVLRGVGRVLRGTVRADDVPARYGGEEFVVVLRRATEESAVEIAQRLRVAVRSLDLTEVGIDGPVTVSVGVAVGVASARSLVERADAALYRAKRHGRDRVEVG
jgi:diguanylate cyclase (GGDEF)-like protein